MVTRVGAAVGIFLLGFVALRAGVGVSERLAVAMGGDGLSHAYYALGLFVLGGLDLGVPEGGPPLARAALWAAYFLAPLVTTSAVIEGLLRAMGPDRGRWRRRSDHVVVFGFGRLAKLYIDRLRTVDSDVPVLVVDRAEHHTSALQEFHTRQRIFVMQGSLTSPGILERVGAAQARRVLLLTGDDFEGERSVSWTPTATRSSRATYRTNGSGTASRTCWRGPQWWSPLRATTG